MLPPSSVCTPFLAEAAIGRRFAPQGARRADDQSTVSTDATGPHTLPISPPDLGGEPLRTRGEAG
jgi:hypothetical protein